MAINKLGSYNVIQITGYDLVDEATEDISISVPKRQENKDGTGKVIMVDETIKYVTAITKTNIIKLGYCCEPSAMIYPIFLERNGVFNAFQPGKEGMYEMQIEEWEGYKQPEEEYSDVIITGIKVPAEMNFTLDLVIDEGAV